MNIFKSISFYIAVFGIAAAVLFTLYLSHIPAPAKFVQKPSASPFKNYIAASGIVEGLDKNIDVGGPEDGLVEKLWVKVGDRVQKGDPLFQLDDRSLKAKLMVQKANLAVEEAQIEKQKNRLSRFREISDPRAITKDEMLSLEDDIHISRAKVDAAKAEIDETERRINRLTVHAPITGEVLVLDIREGEYLTSSKSKLVLGNLDHFQLRVSIDEQSAGLFQKNGAAVAYPKNNAKIQIPLHFSRIEPFVIPKQSLTGQSAERVDTRVLQVIYTFDPPPNYFIYVGQQMDVDIEIKGPQQ